MDLLLNLIIAVDATIIAIALCFLLVSSQRWLIDNKKARTFDLISNFDQLTEQSKIFDNLSDYRSKLSDNAATKDFATLMNRYESIAIGLRSGYYDDEILFEYMGRSLIGAWRRSQPMITDIRVSNSNPNIYLNFEAIARRWEERTRIK